MTDTWIVTLRVETGGNWRGTEVLGVVLFSLDFGMSRTDIDVATAAIKKEEKP